MNTTKTQLVEGLRPLLKYVTVVPRYSQSPPSIIAYKDNHLKTQIGKGMELRVSIWHSGMREAFLIHVGSAWDRTVMRENGQAREGDQETRCQKEETSS